MDGVFLAILELNKEAYQFNIDSKKSKTCKLSVSLDINVNTIAAVIWLENKAPERPRLLETKSCGYGGEFTESESDAIEKIGTVINFIKEQRKLNRL